ncbi:MAG: hypothetical protein K9L75_05210 [Spirochaetia bacterium]|nr:hypothetical protein [Spirochaetia bacterium]
MTADFTPDRPKPNMAAYVLDADEDHSYWLTGSVNVGGRRASLQDGWTQQFFQMERMRVSIVPGAGLCLIRFQHTPALYQKLILSSRLLEVLDLLTNQMDCAPKYEYPKIEH